MAFLRSKENHDRDKMKYCKACISWYDWLRDWKSKCIIKNLSQK